MNLSSQLICRHCQKPKSEHHQFYACQDLRLKRNCELDTFFEPLPSDHPSPTPSPNCNICGKPYSVHTNYVCLPDGTTHGAAPLPQPTDTMNTPKQPTSPIQYLRSTIHLGFTESLHKEVRDAVLELATRLDTIEQKTDNAIVEIRHMVSLLNRDGVDMDKRVRNMQTEINMLTDCEVSPSPMTPNIIEAISNLEISVDHCGTKQASDRYVRATIELLKKEAPVDLSEIKQLLIKLARVLEQSNPSSKEPK